MLFIVATVSSRSGTASRANVAFFVGLSLNFGPVSSNTDVVFDNVVTNVGGSYEEGTGRFVAPVNGVYLFTVVVSALGKQKVRYKLLMY